VTRYAILAAGTILLVLYILHLDPEVLRSAVNGFDRSYAVAIVLLNLAAGLLKTGRWRYFLRKSGIDTGGLRDYLAVNAGFFLGVVTPGTAGEFSRAMYLGKEAPRGLALMTFEKLSDLAVLFLLVLVTAILQIKNGVLVGVGLIAIVAGIAAGYFVLARHYGIMFRPMKSLARVMLSEKRYQNFREMYRDCQFLFGNGRILSVSLLYSLALWVLPLIQVLLIYWGISLHISLRVVAFSYFLPYLAGIVSCVPLGLGVFEFANQGLSLALGEHAASVKMVPLFYRVFVTLPIILFGYGCQVALSFGDTNRSSHVRSSQSEEAADDDAG
jgi:uncharacterized protein (TIRG00374 family)